MRFITASDLMTCDSEGEYLKITLNVLKSTLYAITAMDVYGRGEQSMACYSNL